VVFRPTIARGLALSAVFYRKTNLSYLIAISMPTDIYYCNQLIVKKLLTDPTLMKIGEATLLVTGG
jgi:hypothetical protein